MSKFVDRPWKPARITTLPASSDSRIRVGRMSTILAAPCWVSVMIPACEPVYDAALQPRAFTAIASRDIAIRSPAVRSMSSSRGSGTGVIPLASRTSSSVVSPIAETTATTSLPASRVRTTRSATPEIRDASPTDVPPYFCTTMGMSRRVAAALLAAGSRAQTPSERFRKSTWTRSRFSVTAVERVKCVAFGISTSSWCRPASNNAAESRSVWAT